VEVVAREMRIVAAVLDRITGALPGARRGFKLRSLRERLIEQQ
jgi:hypothetical protein